MFPQLAINYNYCESLCVNHRPRTTMPTPNKPTRAAAALDASDLLAQLAAYQPTVVSTIFAGLDTEASDIDVVCEYADQAEFVAAVRAFVRLFSGASLEARRDHVVARFEQAGFAFEIYGSPTPIDEQLGVRHFRVMRRLARLGGEPFCEQVRARKRAGQKTEPAIASLLNLPGDPYQAVAGLEDAADEELELLLRRGLSK